jgi:hypothetical protein
MLTTVHNEEKKIAGADEVYPLIVYALLKSNIRKLKSNLRYIKCFRHETRLESRDDYYFTTIETAVGFIDKIKHIELNIKENDFIRLCVEQEEAEMERMKTPKLAFKSNYL